MPVVAVVKWGNSLAVRIPKAVAEDAGLREGDVLTMEAGLGQIELRRTERIPTLKELVARITPENRMTKCPRRPRHRSGGGVPDHRPEEAVSFCASGDD